MVGEARAPLNPAVHTVELLSCFYRLSHSLHLMTKYMLKCLLVFLSHPVAYCVETFVCISSF